VDEQVRFDETKSRLMQIRRAMIGDSSRSLNGEPLVSGFVADMGRLPDSLQELVDIGSLAVWQQLPWVPPAELSGVVTIHLYGGWRGPYIDTLPDSSGERRYRDGWGKDDGSANFGWVYQLDDLNAGGVSAVAVQVQSLGANGVADALLSGVYEADYPLTGQYLVSPEDYEVALNGLAVRFNLPITGTFAPNDSLFLRLYFVNQGEIEPVEIDNVQSDDGLLFESVSGVGGLSGVQTQAFTFDSASNAPFYYGNYAAVVLCRTAPDTYIVFDGDCSAPVVGNPQPYYFTLVPRSNLPTLQWNIQ
jgi:hypothetical protein